MLDVRRLRLLRELSLRGTIAEVGEVLHLSPSSVSQQLSLLEHEAQVELLRKVGRRVQLTPAAEVLVEHAGAILDRLERAEAEIAHVGAAGSQAQATGTLRIAAFQSAAVAFMPDLLADLAAGHPRLRVTMSQRVPEEALRETVAREFDLVIAEQYPQHAAPRHGELDRVPLTTDALRLAVPGSGSGTGSRWDAVDSIAGAAHLPWVMEPQGAASRHYAEQLCREAGFEPDVRFETDDLQTQIALIESGNALTILPDLMLVHGTGTGGGQARGSAARMRMIGLAGNPRRSVFTATRTVLAQAPAVRACRATLAAIVPPDLPLVSASDRGGAGRG